MDTQFPSNLGNALFTLVSKANSLNFELTGLTSSIPNHDTPPNTLLLLFGVSTSSGEFQVSGVRCQKTEDRRQGTEDS